MEKQVLYKHGDNIKFMYEDNIKLGVIVIIDADGTFEQNEEPSYDIYVQEENCIYKHVRQSQIEREEI